MKIKGWALKNKKILISKFFATRNSARRESIILVGGRFDPDKIYQVVRVELNKIRNEIYEV